MSLQVILRNYFTRAYPPDYHPTMHLEVNTHDPNRDISKFRVSDAGKCLLMRYWKRQGKPGSPFDGNWFILEAGNLFHAYIQQICREMNCLLQAEGTLEDEHCIGHFDMVLHDEGYLTLYDIKTCSDKQFYYKKKNDLPDKQHIAQIVSYARMYYTIMGTDIPILRIAYLNRDSLDILEKPVNYYAHEKATIQDWKTLIDCWNEQDEPTPTPQEWECRYCPYRTECRYTGMSSL